jgi:hypothetical protein
MTLQEIYATFTPGSAGFCAAIVSNGSWGVNRDEAQRIAEMAATAEEFQQVWDSDSSWTDDSYEHGNHRVSPTCRNENGWTA